MTRSQTHDRRIYRFFFVAKARCNHCFDVFLAPAWAVKEEARPVRSRSQLTNDLSGSQKRSIFRSDSA